MGAWPTPPFLSCAADRFKFHRGSESDNQAITAIPFVWGLCSDVPAASACRRGDPAVGARLGHLELQLDPGHGHYPGSPSLAAAVFKRAGAATFLPVEGYRRSRGPPADPKQRPCIVALQCRGCRDTGPARRLRGIHIHRDVPTPTSGGGGVTYAAPKVPTLVGGRGRSTSTLGLGPCRPGTFVSSPTYSPPRYFDRVLNGRAR